MKLSVVTGWLGLGTKTTWLILGKKMKKNIRSDIQHVSDYQN